MFLGAAGVQDACHSHIEAVARLRIVRLLTALIGDIERIANGQAQLVCHFLAQERFTASFRPLTVNIPIGGRNLCAGKVRARRHDGLLVYHHGLVAVGRYAQQFRFGDHCRAPGCGFQIKGNVVAGGHEDHIRAVVPELGSHLTGHIVIDGHKTGQDGGTHSNGQQCHQHS